MAAGPRGPRLHAACAAGRRRPTAAPQRAPRAHRRPRRAALRVHGQRAGRPPGAQRRAHGGGHDRVHRPGAGPRLPARARRGRTPPPHRPPDPRRLPPPCRALGPADGVPRRHRPAADGRRRTAPAVHPDLRRRGRGVHPELPRGGSRGDPARRARGREHRPARLLPAPQEPARRGAGAVPDRGRVRPPHAVGEHQPSESLLRRGQGAGGLARPHRPRPHARLRHRTGRVLHRGHRADDLAFRGVRVPAPRGRLPSPAHCYLRLRLRPSRGARGRSQRIHRPRR